ncbi:MAG TPA: serine hydrolase [Acidimicrobiales bacterium]|nr:serine hydrolase [Acidimicrobiales bacterium]
MRRLVVLLVLVVSQTAACGGSDGGATGRSVKTVDGLVAWIATHREHVGLVVKNAEGKTIVALNPDALFPLASTRKVLILGALAAAVDAGREKPDAPVSLPDIDHWFVGLDGGAHDRAMDDLRRRDRVVGETVTLADVAWAMTRFSSNAAADYLLDRVGGSGATSAFAAAAGMVAQEPLFPIAAEFSMWSAEPDRWLEMSPVERVVAAEQLVSHTQSWPRPGSIDRVGELARASVRGTPAEWAELMSRLQRGTVLGREGLTFARAALNWPLELNPGRFAEFGTKGGSLPGVITEASFVKATHGSPVALALFFRDLPADVESTLSGSRTQQALIIRVAEDDAFRRRLRARLNR